MIVVIDVHYKKNYAKAVALDFSNWEDDTFKGKVIKNIDEVAEYVPGKFYKRELPCILVLLEDYKLEEVSYIVVDGFVNLSDEGKLGLGGYLYEAIQGVVPVIGVAKSSFHGIKEKVIPVLRGESKNPLWVTAEGIDLQTAAKHIQQMHGDYRMPKLLQELDTFTKED